MASINFNEIYSRFFSKVEAFDFLYEEVSAEALAAHMSEWIAATLSHPHIRKLFKTIEVNDEDGTITYEMNYEMDEYSEFLLLHAFNHGIYGTDISYKAGRIAVMGRNLRTGKIKSAFSAIFLPYYRMKAQFPVLEKYPLLLPYCWSKRIIQQVKGGLKSKKKMLDYSNIGKDEYNEIKRFLQAGGCI